MSSSGVPGSIPSVRDRRLLIFVVAAFVIGTMLRLAYPADIEYKRDERWMFEKTQEVAEGKAWPAAGMPSSQGVVNPGLSVWSFIVLQKLSGARTPIGLARAVQIVNILAILVLFLFIAVGIPQVERLGWLWGAALVCVNPLAVVFHRKIWAQSLLPLLAMVFLIGWWYRRRHWAGALVWGLAGALLGQIHMAGFFLAAAVVAWTILFDPERKAVRWIAWTAGTLLGSLGLLPWLLELSTQTGGGGPAFHLSAWVNFKWWNYWVSNNSGIVMEHFLGDHFRSFLGYPLIGQQPTYLVGGVHVLLVLCLLYVIGLVIRRLIKTRGSWFGAFTGVGSESSLIIASYLWGCGILITLAGVVIQRHYLLVAFPLLSIWLGRLLADDRPRGTKVFGLIWSAQLLVSALLLYYIHVNGGAPNGDYGVSYSATLLE